mmetsp:Transcript_36956/g.44702  ORF Transcript_36956/g.44702 Transcript_36956/m.44702 type:complete len:257 (-) Transcript_36956:210-980(-)|eukprot:CAMPEP_0197843906 /NCGR_PEP_ID=MMETSP1438-20131217/885_1 /TAXON_ID=1461541 /ORGANISM="Pterosperma sp., Strain CCMP1384" /LENGTH=256 /DNA_ID=CAMNT_0043454379 /DNA_START=417 /DNA_END=1187 /DNA_ORIENTATION=-
MNAAMRATACKVTVLTSRQCSNSVRSSLARCSAKAPAKSFCSGKPIQLQRLSTTSIATRQQQFRKLSCTSSSEAVPEAAAPEAEAEPLLVDKLDIRVGKIVKAWVHPDADSLYVEEVDCGEEDGPRTICSGLVKYVPEAELQDRMVAVLCNLKPRNMRGIKSNGMLLAASDEAHETVELLSIPEGAAIGERIKFGTQDAVQQDPGSPNQVQKKKIFEAIAPDLNTSAEKVVRWKDLAMLTSAGEVKAQTLANGKVS